MSVCTLRMEQERELQISVQIRFVAWVEGEQTMKRTLFDEELIELYTTIPDGV